MAATHEARDEVPDPDQIPRVGCLAKILRAIPMPDGTRTVILQGIQRFRIDRILRRSPYLIAKVSYPPEKLIEDDELEALTRNVRQQLRTALEHSPGVSSEISVAVHNIDRQGALADFAVSLCLMGLNKGGTRPLKGHLPDLHLLASREENQGP